MLEAATEQLATIAGQRPSVRRARKSIAAFKLREGMPVGVVGDPARRAQLRVPRPADVGRDPAHPRLPRHEPAVVRRPRQLLAGGARADHLPGDRLRRIDQTRGLDITITTSAKTDHEAFALLEAFGFPFARPEAAPAAAPAGAGRAAAAEAAAAAAAVEETAAAEDAAEAEAVAAEGELAVDEVAEELVEELVAEELVEEAAEELLRSCGRGARPRGGCGGIGRGARRRGARGRGAGRGRAEELRPRSRPRRRGAREERAEEPAAEEPAAEEPVQPPRRPRPRCR